MELELKDLLSYSISLTALALSITGVWFNNLKPFKAEIVTGEPKICVPFIGDSWLPGIDISISFCNIGRRPGKIYDVRARVYDSDKHRSYKFTLHAQYVVDGKEFAKVRTNYNEWHKGITRTWSPLILLGMTTETIHIFLRGKRIEEKVFGDFQFDLEVFTSKEKKWTVINTFVFPLNGLAYTGTQFSVDDGELERIRKK